MMIATSIEQSKRLIEAGIPKASADMCLAYGKLETNRASLKNEFPAWSLSALWDYIHNLDKTYDFPTTMSAEELIETLVNTIVYRMKH